VTIETVFGEKIARRHIDELAVASSS